MPNKNPGKTEREPGQQFTPQEQNLQSAYQIHTLAQIMYGQLYGAQPWIGPTGPAHQPYPAQPWTPMANPVGGPWGPEIPSWIAPAAPQASHVPPTGFHGLQQHPFQWPPFYGYPYGCIWSR